MRLGSIVTEQIDQTTLAVGLAARPARNGWRLSQAARAYRLNAPALVLITVLTIYPFVGAFWESLHQYSMRRPGMFPFVGLANYLSLLETSDFWNALYVTLVFTFWTTVLVLAISVGVSLVLNEPFRGRGFTHALILLPWAMPGVVNALRWQWVYNGQVGHQFGRVRRQQVRRG